MPAIFISYRRSDSEGEAGRLSDLLTSRFSGQSVFMDVDSIQPGRDFRKAIEESIQACSVFLTIIGPGWLGATTPNGVRRLEAPNDYVRLEIAAALRRDTPVIPVLVRGAHMPQPEQLPPEIQELAYRNSVELTHARWKSDLQVLIDALEPLLHRAEPTHGLAPASDRRQAEAAHPPATYPRASAPLSHHIPPQQQTPPPNQPSSTYLGPSARRAAYSTPLPPSPFADTPTPARHSSSVSHLRPAFSDPKGITVDTTPPAAARPYPQDVSPSVDPPTPSTHLQTGPLPTTPLAAAAVDRVSKDLAHFIGPIAEIVVKRAARCSATLEDLIAAVSHEIESAPDRARFLAQSKK